MRRISPITLVCLGLLLPATSVRADSNIDDDAKFAWSENAGWLNWRDANGSADDVRFRRVFNDPVNQGYLEGWIWSENLGWINVGDGDGPYPNTDHTNFGVNIRNDALVVGVAWSESVGWINFNTSFFIGADGARFVDNRFSGFAWSGNVGWILIGDDGVFIEIKTCPGDFNLDAQINGADLSFLLANWGATEFAAENDLANDDGVFNAADLSIVLSGWGACP